MTIRDDGETIGLFEPLRVGEDSKHRAALNDLTLELARRSEGFRRSLPSGIAEALADLIRAMNCYYSNLIEGHNTHPIQIERALAGDYSNDIEKRNLQLEARAHIEVQRWIDVGGMTQAPTSPQMIVELHRRFCENLPEALLVATDPVTGEDVPVVPGAFREKDVKVGRHIAVSPGAIPRFLDRLHDAYRNLGKIDAVLSAAWAHHRLLWVHPFIDGNGRVARLMSYAMLRDSLDTGGLWSVARGLARNEKRYKHHLNACDLPRRNDLDGRGSLSEEALAEFTQFFLEICLDQVAFMEGLMAPDELRTRMLIWAEEQMRLDKLPPKSDLVLKALLYEGTLERAAIPEITALSERSARRITSALIESGGVSSQTTRAPLKLAFPAKHAERWMPGLFPPETETATR
ncbi:MAG: Fic family protein [Pseudomonadota bacterium]